MQSDTERPPVLSIIAPVYKVEEFLPRCMDSILAQTFADWECICVDNSSPDGCGAILDDYAAKDARFVVIHKENGGPASARNAALEVVRGEYISFIDSDDWVEPNLYEVAIGAAKKTGADIVQWGWIEEKEGEAVPAEELPEGLFDVRQNVAYYSVVPWGKLYRSAIVLKNRLRFPAELRAGEDLPFALKSYALAKKTFYINKPLYHYRIRGGSAVRSLTVEQLELEDEVLAKAMAFVEESCADWCKAGGDKVILWQKIRAKNTYLVYPKEPDFKHFHSVFPEASGPILWLRWFIESKRPGLIINLLAAWHLHAPARALMWLRKKVKKL